MGNHEYCEDCGASDFHHGRPCDPTRKAAFEAEKVQNAARQKAAREKLAVLATELNSRGYQAEFNVYGTLQVNARNP